MDITEVRVKLVDDQTDRLKAFCSITLDEKFVVRDLKVIEGTNGLFVAMPSRKLADRCAKCGHKNHLRAKFCNECGQRLGENRMPKDANGRSKLHADIAHPINAACREEIQARVVAAFTTEAEASKSPDYTPAVYDEDYAEVSDYDSLIEELKKDGTGRRDRRDHPAEPRRPAAEHVAPPVDRRERPPPRDDRQPREDRPPSRPAPVVTERRPQHQPAPAPVAAKSGFDADLGVAPAPEPRREPEPRPRPVPVPRQPAPVVQTAPPTVAREPEGDDFSAGIL